MKHENTPVRPILSQRLQELLQNRNPDEVMGLFEKFLENREQGAITVHQAPPIPPAEHEQKLPQVSKQKADQLAMYMRPLDVHLAAERAISSPVRWG